MPPIRQPVNRCGTMTKKGLKCCRRANPVSGFCSHHLGYTTAGGAGEQNMTTSQHAPAEVAGTANAGDDGASDQDMISQDASTVVAGASNDQDMASKFANLEAVGVTSADDEAINDQDMTYQHTLAEAGAVGADAGAIQEVARSPPAGLASPLTIDVGAEPTDGDGPVNPAAQDTPDTNNATAQDAIEEDRNPNMDMLRDVLSKVSADDLLVTVGHFIFTINTLVRMPELGPDVRHISLRARGDMAIAEGEARIEKYRANMEIVRRRLAAYEAMAEGDVHADGDAQGGDAEEANGGDAEEANGDGEQQDASAMEI